LILALGALALTFVSSSAFSVASFFGADFLPYFLSSPNLMILTAFLI